VIRVHDGLVPDPQAYRQAALALPFQSITFGPVVFHGIAPCADLTVPQWLAATYPDLDVVLSFFRQSPAGQVEPNDIHTDVDMGDMTLILYLNPDPPAGDGTTFWRRRTDGAIAATEVVMGEAGRREDFEPWQTVPAAFNRGVVFDAPYFHSRAIAENYGQGEDARLIQVLFATRRG